MLKNAQCKFNNSVISGKEFGRILGIRDVKFGDAILDGTVIRIEARTTNRHARCPLCNRSSTSVHSHYQRHIIDLPIHHYHVVISLGVRKFRCHNHKCPRKVFSEQNTLLTMRYARRSNLLTDYLRKLVVELSSKKCSYICKLTGISQSPSTCLRIANSIALPTNYDDIKHICIDDFAFKKGVTYGSIIVDCDTGRPVKLISGRDLKSVVDALELFPSIETVSRDRASAFSKAVESSFPEANQIADRFHLIMNCGDHITEQIKRMNSDIRKQVIPDYNENEASKVEVSTMGEPSSKKKQIFDDVHRLSEAGLSQHSIASELGINRKTVKKYLQCDAAPGRTKAFRTRYEEYLPIISEGIKGNLRISQIHKNVRNAGLDCCYVSFKYWMQNSFPEYIIRRGRYSNPSNRQYSNDGVLQNSQINRALSSARLPIYVCNPDWGVDKNTGECSAEHEIMEKIIGSSKILQDLRSAFSSFREVFKGGNPDNLDTWINNWISSEYGRLKTFANGMSNDLQAIKNAIKFSYNNGLAEGTNNKLKALKRGMYGRAGNHLLEIKMVMSVTG